MARGRPGQLENGNAGGTLPLLKSNVNSLS